MKTAQQKHSPVLMIACLASLCTQSGLTMYSPSIPYLVSIFHTSYTSITYSMTAYLLGYALSMFFVGGLSDQWGRRKSYFLVLGIFSLSSLLLAITSSIHLFIAARLLQGIGGGGCAVIARTSVRDISEGKSLVRGMSYISIAFYFSMGAFQYIGGLVQTYAYYTVDFFFMFFFSLSLLLLVFFRFDETHYQSGNRFSIRQFASDYAIILKEKYLMIIALGGGIGYAILLAFNIMGAFFLQKCLNVSPETIGIIGLYLSMSYILGSIITNYLIKQWKIETLISIGKTILFAAGCLSLVNALREHQTIFYVVFPIMFGVVGQAMLYPCSMIKAVEPYKKTPGAAGSLFGFTQQLSGFVISIIVGWLPYQHILYFGSLIFFIGFISFLLLMPRFL